MKIENSIAYNGTPDISCAYKGPTVQEIGTYRIQRIQDWGYALLVQLNSLENPSGNATLKIYVDKERFKSFFAEEDSVTRFRQIPEEGIRETEFQGRPVDNTSDFLVNNTNLHQSQLFYPWDPQD